MEPMNEINRSKDVAAAFDCINYSAIRSLRQKLFYNVEISHAVNELENFSVVVVGPPRVGKSTLINAFTGENLAATNGGFTSCTKEIHDYSYEIKGYSGRKKIHFYDLPGIESWKPEDLDNFINELFDKTKPIIVMIVVSPNCFLNPDTMNDVIHKFYKRNIVLCFVLTNKYTCGKYFYLW